MTTNLANSTRIQIKQQRKPTEKYNVTVAW